MIDLAPIRARLEPIDRDFWRDACAPIAGDTTFPADRVFVQNAPDDIAALLAEVERLRAEIDRLQGDLEDAKMGYCPMCNVFGGCAHTSEGEE